MTKVMPMVDMEMDDEEMGDMAMPMPIKERPRYPYGLRICLTDAELAKLNLDPKDAFVGGMVHIHAMACITSMSCNDTEDGQCCRVELELQKMCIESEDMENEAEDAEDVPQRRRAAMYGR